MFLKEHGMPISQDENSDVSAINVRSLLISYGTKGE